jgi:hypothetical protein
MSTQNSRSCRLETKPLLLKSCRTLAGTSTQPTGYPCHRSRLRSCLRAQNARPLSTANRLVPCKTLDWRRLRAFSNEMSGGHNEPFRPGCHGSLCLGFPSYTGFIFTAASAKAAWIQPNKSRFSELRSLNCPHAASMSGPRDRRKCATTPRARSSATNPSATASGTGA